MSSLNNKSKKKFILKIDFKMKIPYKICIFSNYEIFEYQ